jgi:hypothetical protein
MRNSSTRGSPPTESPSLTFGAGSDPPRPTCGERAGVRGQNVKRPWSCSQRGVFHCCVTTPKFEFVGSVFG